MMNIRILLCLLFLVHAAFARVAKDVAGMDMSMMPSSSPSSTMPSMPEEEEAKPSAMPGLKPLPMLPSSEAVADEPQAPPHSHSQVGTGDEPFGSADLEPEEVSAPNPGSVGSGPAPPSPSSSGAGQLPDDDDTSEESDEEKGH